MEQPLTQQNYTLLNNTSHGSINYHIGYYQRCRNSH
jgi:hypothetical protein